MNKRRLLGIRITNALIVASDWGQDANGIEAYQWIVDQMVRELLGSEENYRKWVDNIEQVSGASWRTGEGPEDE
jgi:hypothetical protein